jgi:1-deoxy-D-xylulose-5-phosphate reductoisomerase
MRNLAIIGSTGSIGRQALEVIGAHPDKLKVVALAAGKNNLEELAQQINSYAPNVVSVPDEQAASILKNLIDDNSLSKLDIMIGEAGLEAVATCAESNLLLTAIVGFAGVKPTIAAIKKGITIALANKETLVAAGSVIMPLAKDKNVQIIPVDSEHSAIHQSLRGSEASELKHIWLTASGGPFRTWTKEQIDNATMKEALNHPNWSMGKKITIDSASLMNKGLEIIEARWLFDCHPDKIKVVIHPQSILHSAVEFCDGSLIGQFGLPDMKLPIHYALFHPKRVEFVDGPSLNLQQLGNLTFESPDYDRFPCLKIAQEVAKEDSTSACVLNSANEIVVEAFLQGKIRFKDISSSLVRVLEKHNSIANPELEDILEADQWAREKANAIVGAMV